MIQVRRSDERGTANHGWLDTRFTFSFADYHDPKFMGFRHLRVINEDFVAPSKGFGMHPHNDMEIITYILKGELEHKDDMGSGSVIREGDVQHMTAGTGVFHSEFNPSTASTTHLLQIWIFPDKRGYTPRYDEKHFGDEAKANKLCLIASKTGEDGSLPIEQNAKVFASKLSEGKSVDYAFVAERHGWLQLIEGKLTINGTIIEAGDGVAIAEENTLKITSQNEKSHFLLFDLP